jgi:hypothetical protein
MSVALENTRTLPLAGAMKPVMLCAEPPECRGRAEFIEAVSLPGRGMNLINVRGQIPGIGETELLHSPPLEDVSAPLSGGSDDFTGVHSFRFGLAKPAEKQVDIEVLDPAAHYGFRITGAPPHIQAVQVHSPDQPFEVVEPQFNLAEPFSRVWAKFFGLAWFCLVPDSYCMVSDMANLAN